ncbi:MAG: ferrochelatase [Candidatus Azobacteroides sp.]|nr:ferrochelatase [Candidatus Azobacteroides sp.]
MKKNRTALLLMNIATPESPGLLHVGIYLSRFLGNKHVITLPWFWRKLLVNAIIVPFRTFKSAARYKQLWEMYENNFPITCFGESVKDKLQEMMEEENITVFSAFSQGKNNIKNKIKEIGQAGFSDIILFPLFSQYASSSTRLVLEQALKEIRKFPAIKKIEYIESFYAHLSFIKAWKERVINAHPEKYEFVIFSYHSLPLTHIQDPALNNHAYEEDCRKTSALIAEKAGIKKEQTATVFHSRMGTKWLGPSLSEMVVRKATDGIKSILVIMPGFVCDCLETVVEIEEYKHLFLQAGGEKLELVENLNDYPLWIQALKDISQSRLYKQTKENN